MHAFKKHVAEKHSLDLTKYVDSHGSILAKVSDRAYVTKIDSK